MKYNNISTRTYFNERAITFSKLFYDLRMYFSTNNVYTLAERWWFLTLQIPLKDNYEKDAARSAHHDTKGAVNYKPTDII